MSRTNFAITIFALSIAAMPVAAGAGVTSKEPAAVPAGHYEVDPTHTSVQARVDHMGFSTTTVAFDKVSGGFDLDPSKPEEATLSITIDPSVMNSGFAKRDDDLKGPGFFDVANFKSITYRSSKLTRIDATHATIEGELTLHGVTKPVTLNLTFNGTGNGMMGDTRAGFLATATLLRSDFGMKTFLPAVGDEVDILIDAEFTKK